MSSYVSDLKGVDAYIEKLVAGVRSCLQEQCECKTEIPLFLYATGGVRKLSGTDQHKLFASIRNSHFPFRIQSKTVLSGKSICFFLIQGSRKHRLVYSQWLHCITLCLTSIRVLKWITRSQKKKMNQPNRRQKIHHSRRSPPIHYRILQ